MKTIHFFGILASSALLIACAPDQQLYSQNGQCLTCFNNPITLEPINYTPNDKKTQSEATVINWNDLMLAELRASQVKDTAPYAQDYLKVQTNLNYSALTQNELTLKKEIIQANNNLAAALNNTALEENYQFTFASELGLYDYDKKQFPIRTIASMTTSANIGTMDLTNLPRTIKVEFENAGINLPGWEMTPSQAESFLNNRKGRGIYVRYIITSLTLKSPAVFTAKIKKLNLLIKSLVL